MTKKKSYIKVITAMLIWGSLGVFVKQVPLESSQIVLGRITLGFLFLFTVYKIGKSKSSLENLKKALFPLLISGALMGFNWVFLFEAYNYTTVSMSTIAYYFAPVMVMIVSPIVLKERITLQKVLGIISAMAGLILISGNVTGGADPRRGFIYGLCAAALYASVTLINKKVSGISGIEITLIQLIGAGIVILPYSIFSNTTGWQLPGALGIICLLIVGIVHSGIALFLYFSAIQELPGQSVALCSYIDPASAIFFSALFLGDRLGVMQLFGAALILGGALFGEISFTRQRKEK